MTDQRESTFMKNPKRVVAGRLNQRKRRGLTDAGREVLRKHALDNQPWRFSTGPKTVEGKLKAKMNGKSRQVDTLSKRETSAQMQELREILMGIVAVRRTAEQHDLQD